MMSATASSLLARGHTGVSDLRNISVEMHISSEMVDNRTKTVSNVAIYWRTVKYKIDETEGYYRLGCDAF
jgi:hypothetical protein